MDNTFRRWQSTGRIDAILEALQLHFNEEGLIDIELWRLDSSNVRASKNAAGARKKTRRSIKLLAAHVAVLAAKSTWSQMAMVCRWDSAFRLFSTRYEKLAGSFAAFIELAFGLRYFRELLADRKPAF